jgi:hypothetical protein
MRDFGKPEHSISQFRFTIILTNMRYYVRVHVLECMSGDVHQDATHSRCLTVITIWSAEVYVKIPCEPSEDTSAYVRLLCRGGGGGGGGRGGGGGGGGAGPGAGGEERAK